MIATTIFGILIIAINIFFVVDTISVQLANIHWLLIVLAAIISIAYFIFIIYLVSLSSFRTISHT